MSGPITAAAATFVAFVLSFSAHANMAFLSMLLAGLLTLLAFVIDLAFFLYVRHKVGQLPNFNAQVVTAAGKSEGL